MKSLAVVVQQPEQLALIELDVNAPTVDDVVVDIDYSGISTGTERLLYSGRMPHFPGMGYPLVPGYESVGTVRDAGAKSERAAGDRVFVPGSNCFGPVRGLFGGAARQVVVPGARTVRLDDDLGERSVLFALAATAHHALAPAIDAGDFDLPDLIVGHGVLGRLLARLAVALGGAPTVWETDAARRDGAAGYAVCDPGDDERRDYRAIFDVSGDAGLLDTLMTRLARGGEIVLAGFYSEPISFVFAPAFMREARMRVAAEWQRSDLDAVQRLVGERRLSLDELITHRHDVTHAKAAYRQAFEDPSCLKTVLDWRAVQ